MVETSSWFAPTLKSGCDGSAGCFGRSHATRAAVEMTSSPVIAFIVSSQFRFAPATDENARGTVKTGQFGLAGCGACLRQARYRGCRSPARIAVERDGRQLGQAGRIGAVRVHNEDLAVTDHPTVERDHLSVGRPGGGPVFPRVKGESHRVRAVRIHDMDLRVAVAIAYERDLPPVG